MEIDHDRQQVVAWGAPKIERLTKCFTQIASALYFFQYDKIFGGEIKLKIGFLQKIKGNVLADAEMHEKLFERDLKNIPVQGNNPSVFTYQVADPDKDGLSIFWVNPEFAKGF